MQKSSSQSSTSLPITELIIDLSGRPDLLSISKTAVEQLLMMNGQGNNGKSKKSSSDSVQVVGSTQIFVQLPTIVTGDMRNQLIKQGTFCSFSLYLEVLAYI